MVDGAALAVDFGTSNTVAALRQPGQAPRLLLFDGLPLLPSAVYADPAEGLLVGRDAQHSARLDPTRFEPNPKRRVDDGTVLLGDTEFPVTELFAAVLRRVRTEAATVAGTVPPARLTFPAAWGARRQRILTTAAAAAGLEVAGLTAEPVAAAARFAELPGTAFTPGRALLVFDFGGGTLDVSVVRHGPAGLDVAGYDGLDDLGGLDIDAALVVQVGQVVAAAAPHAWRALASPTTAAEQRNRRMLWDDVRSAKEMLSRTSLAPVPVPGYEPGVHLTRDELNRLAQPLLERAVRTTSGVLNHTGVGQRELAGIFLVGGSSRLPLVAELLLRRLRVAPTVLEQPEAVVALGALPTDQPAGVAPTRPAASAPAAATADTSWSTVGGVLTSPPRPEPPPPPARPRPRPAPAPARRVPSEPVRLGLDRDAKQRKHAEWVADIGIRGIEADKRRRLARAVVGTVLIAAAVVGLVAFLITMANSGNAG